MDNRTEEEYITAIMYKCAKYAAGIACTSDIVDAIGQYGKFKYNEGHSVAYTSSYERGKAHMAEEMASTNHKYWEEGYENAKYDIASKIGLSILDSLLKED